MDGVSNTSSTRVKPQSIALGGYVEARAPSKLRRAVKVLLAVAALTVLFGAAGSYLYWRSLRSTPQYSLALVIDAAKRGDNATVDRLVDIDAVIEDFLPQITTKAVELYGRGLPTEVLRRVEAVAQPVMPAIKDRARLELPGAIRGKTSDLGYVPFEAMVLGADQYLDIAVEGDRASVKGRGDQDHIQLTMKRDGESWKIVSVKDDQLATAIARRVGQEIIAIASDPRDTGGTRLGVQNINELLNEAEKILK